MADQSKQKYKLSEHLKEILIGVIVTVLSAVLITWFSLDKVNNTKCLDPNLNRTITGNWVQHLRYPEQQEWLQGGAYKVYIEGECLAMSPIDVSMVGQNMSTPNEIIDVKFDGTEWSFRSHLQDGRILVFRLERKSDTLYEGYSYIDGKVVEENQWVKLPNR